MSKLWDGVEAVVGKKKMNLRLFTNVLDIIAPPQNKQKAGINITEKDRTEEIENESPPFSQETVEDVSRLEKATKMAEDENNKLFGSRVEESTSLYEEDEKTGMRTTKG